MVIHREYLAVFTETLKTVTALRGVVFGRLEVSPCSALEAETDCVDAVFSFFFGFYSSLELCGKGAVVALISVQVTYCHVQTPRSFTRLQNND